MARTESQPPPPPRAGAPGVPREAPTLTAPRESTAADDASLVTDDATAHLEAPVEPRGALERGVSVGRYVILDRIGEGGMGVVYKAYDPELDRPVALKLVRAGRGRAEARAAARDRLLREARALAKLSHPNIVAVHDVGTFQDDVFLAIEFIEGMTLRRWLREQRRSQGEIVRAFLAAGEGLAAAHASGLIHRDFKPDNVIVGHDGRVRVLDFGLARSTAPREGGAPSGATGSSLASGSVVPSLGASTGGPVAAAPSSSASASDAISSGGSGAAADGRSVLSGSSDATPGASTLAARQRIEAPLTLVDGAVGTPRYMSPEQHLGEPSDGRTDQFSFCVALYEALYGTFPFSGRTLAEMRAAVLLGRAAEPPAGKAVPRWLRQVLLRGLSRAPNDRFPTMAALLGELRRDRTLARRRALQAAVLAGLAVAGVVGWQRARKAQENMCQGAEARAGEVWGPAAKATVRAAFVATGKPYAEDTWRAVERNLDAYTRSWAVMRTEACAATRLRGEQSEELLDLRMQCLDARLTEVQTQVGAFARGEREVVEGAVRASQSLGALATCADVAALRQPVPLPRGAEQQGKVAEARSAAAQARALFEAARFNEGLAAANLGVERAREGGFRPAEAEALLAKGRLERGAGDFRGAEATLRSAWLAAEAGRHEEVRARAWIELVWVRGDGLGQYGSAHDAARTAEAILEPMGPQEALRGTLLRNDSNTYFREGKYQEAIAVAGRALELLERALGAEHPDLGDTHNQIGHGHYALGHADEARSEYTRALTVWQNALGPNHPQVARALNNLGNIANDAGRYDEAESYFLRAVHIWEAALGPHAVTLSMPFSNLGIVASRRGELEKAREYYGKAIAIIAAARGPEHPSLFSPYHGLGSVEFTAKQYQASFDSYRQALTVLEKSAGPSHPELSLALCGMAKASLELNQVAAAQSYAERARALAEKGFGPEHPVFADSLRRLGDVALAQGDPAKAVALLERAVRLRQSGHEDPSTVAETRFAFAKALWPAGQRARARDEAEQAAAHFRARTSAADVRLLARIDAWLAAHPAP